MYSFLLVNHTSIKWLKNILFTNVRFTAHAASSCFKPLLIFPNVNSFLLAFIMLQQCSLKCGTHFASACEGMVGEREFSIYVKDPF